MTPDRWERVQEVFGAALALVPEARGSYVERECGGDGELRREVESLLASHDAASSAFLEPQTLATPRTLAARASGQRRAVGPGAQLGPYEIVAMLGSGGMGEVYRARDTRLERDVAVKVLPPSLSGDLSALLRFEREAKAVAALSHPNILSIFDFGREGETAYAVTELLEGQTLRARMKAGPIGVDEQLDLASQILEGLAAAHAKGIVHRDLKPENVFLTGDGRVKILDFGLARRGAEASAPAEVTSAPTATQHTMPGTVMGTLGYMSPEQLLGRTVDQRADLFSVGVILYEMAAGQAPFRGETGAAVAAAILHAEPPALEGAKLPEKLEAFVRRLLAKEPGERYATAEEALEEIQRLVEARRPRMSWAARIAIVAASLVIIALGAWAWRRSERTKWVRSTAIPEIERLVKANDLAKAAALTREARDVLPRDPTLEKLWRACTAQVSLQSDPSGAVVSIGLYGGRPDSRETLGKTPMKARLPQAPAFVYRVEKEGFAPVEFIGQLPITWSWGMKLYPEATVPPEMVVVPSDQSQLPVPLTSLPVLRLGDYFIDRHEVTNEEFKKFVDAGGYRRREFWKQPFVRGGRTLTWEEAVGAFVDSTGRTGPATWEAGAFPAGKGKHPVSGVSWYEAAAYAEFAGKTLPTVYHWTLAAEPGFASIISPGSNFRGRGTQPVGQTGTLSGSGTTDMAGNVKEWCLNEEAVDKRYILGGGFGEPPYRFNQMDAQSPWERRSNFGFRCVKLMEPSPAEAWDRLEAVTRDFLAVKPVSHDVFEAYRGLYGYDSAPLDAKVEATQSAAEWTHETVSYAAAYGGERILAHLFLPKNGSPPYQVVVFFPGGETMWAEKFDPAVIDGGMDFVPKSGRALLYPVYKSSYERRDAYQPGYGFNHPALFRDHVIMWTKDLRRSLDYLQSRPDIDGEKMALHGFSWGGGLGPVYLALEHRFKAAILTSAGFWPWPFLPEADTLNFIRHVRTPVLVLSETLDELFPQENSRAFFKLIGTSESDKRQVYYNATHGNLPHVDEVRECLQWLDKYLGPVKR